MASGLEYLSFIKVSNSCSHKIEARKELDTLSDRLYANPVIEDWDYDLEIIESFPKGIE